jgi:hypothetical protein
VLKDFTEEKERFAKKMCSEKKENDEGGPQGEFVILRKVSRALQAVGFAEEVLTTMSADEVMAAQNQ